MHSTNLYTRQDPANFQTLIFSRDRENALAAIINPGPRVWLPQIEQREADDNLRLFLAAPAMRTVCLAFIEGCERGEVVGEVFFSRLLDEARAALALT